MSTENFETLLKDYSPDERLKKGDLIRGKIIFMNSDYVVVSRGLGLKSESAIPIQEFKNAEGNVDVSVGDMMDFYLECVEDGLGETQLSFIKAKKQAVWKKLQTIKEKKIIGRLNQQKP